MCSSDLTVGLAAIFTPELVVNTSGGIGTITLPWGETVLMTQNEDAVLLPLLLIALLVSIIYIVKIGRASCRERV